MERERLRVAAEIHDGLLPYLFATAAKLSQLRRSSPDLDDRLKDAAEWVDRSREIARELMNAVSFPPEVLLDPLASARTWIDELVLVDPGAVRIQWRCSSKGSQESSSTDHPEAPSMMAGECSESVAILVYRAVTELVRNSVRHANASQITVTCRDVSDFGHWKESETVKRRFQLEVSDDGCGFASEPIPIDHRHGLDWIRHRAEMVQWQMKIESVPGRGTTVVLVGDCE